MDRHLNTAGKPTMRGLRSDLSSAADQNRQDHVAACQCFLLRGSKTDESAEFGRLPSSPVLCFRSSVLPQSSGWPGGVTTPGHPGSADATPGRGHRIGVTARPAPAWPSTSDVGDSAAGIAQTVHESHRRRPGVGDGFTR
jgi:hypothetical protein